MQSLMFLTTRLLLNSLKRSLKHPVRSLALALAVALVALFIAVGGEPTPEVSPLPASEKERLIVFSMLLHLNLLWGVLSPAQVMLPGFALADVNFLFPSPLRRTTVFFFLLLVRGVASSLTMLAVVVLVMFSIGSELLLAVLSGQTPGYLWGVIAYPLMYLMASVATIAIGITVIERRLSDERFSKRFRAVAWAVAGVIVGRLAWSFYQSEGESSDWGALLVRLVLYDPLLAYLLLPLRALSEATFSYATGWSVYIPLGFGMWGAIALLGGMLLWRRQDRLYDLAYQIASLSLQYQWRRQHPISLLREISHFHTMPNVFSRWSPQGVWALLWGNLLVMFRGGGYLLTSLGILWITTTFLVLAQYLWSEHGAEATPLAVMLHHASSLFALMLVQPSFSSAMRRADLVRALPFAPWQMVLMETIPAFILLLLFQTAIWVSHVSLVPGDKTSMTYSYLLGLCMLPSLCLSVMWLSILHPDPADHTQRLVASLLVFPIVLLVALPTLGVLAGWLLAQASLWTALLPIAIINGAVSWVLLRLGAQRYLQVNLAD